MKIRFFAALLLAALAISLFTGCATANAMQQSASAPEITVPTDPIPRSANPDPTPAATPAATGAAHTQLTEAPSLISEEAAEEIALEHAGFTSDQVQQLRTELDYDRGKPEYEVDFRVDRWEYDYDIDAETGKIISFDKDLDD